MTERTNRDAHDVFIRELEPSWKTQARRAFHVERRHKRRDKPVLLLAALLVLLILSGWWVWLA
jgi:hypothetical protein